MKLHKDWCKAISLVALMALVQGCATFQSTEPEPESGTKLQWSELAPKLQAVNSWQLMGKIGIRTPDDSMTAAINQWTQVDDFFTINLSSTFLGIGSASISGSPHQIILSESGEEPRTSDQPDQLIYEALGIPLPITFLPYWVKGLPVPETEHALVFAPNGLPATLSQLGWQLEFSRHQWHQGIPLPGRIRLKQEGITITLAIKQWTLN